MEASEASTVRQSLNPPESPDEPQGFFAEVGVSESVRVELDPPFPPGAESLFTSAQVREVAYDAMGAVLGIVAREYPDALPRSTEATEKLEQVLARHGVRT